MLMREFCVCFLAPDAARRGQSDRGPEGRGERGEARAVRLRHYGDALRYVAHSSAKGRVGVN